MATESDNVNSGALGTLLAVGTIATLGIALVVTALVRTELSTEAEKKDVGADRPYRDLLAEQTATMAAPASYVDRGRGLVSLPIDRAMELTVTGLIKDPNSATPPAPVGGSGGSAATEAGGASAGGTGGSGGVAPEGEAKPEDAKPAEAGKPAEDAKPAEEKKDEKKKDGPKPKPPAPVPAAPVPAAPVPAAPAPAAPAPAPNGQ
ncbi:MAG TPA: hypothetical protein VHP33_41660 [Polyangiaceae bacterium]|nr:hypothetical protein [Polyangiaceae bacterium]